MEKCAAEKVAYDKEVILVNRMVGASEEQAQSRRPRCVPCQRSCSAC